MTAPNPYLAENFAPVHEEVTADRLEVIGRLPQGLEGMFVRNGPNPQFNAPGRYHWFDGDGMLHGVRIQEGRASYRNRFVRTRGFELERQAGRALWSGLLELPNFNDPPEGMLFKNTGNTALAWHDGRCLALWEGGDPHEIELPSLDTKGVYNYGGRLSHPVTAHPKVDAATGEMLFFGYRPMGPEYLHYSVVSPQGEIVHSEPIELPRGVMMHDFAITERYTVFLDLPLVFDPRRLAEGLAPFHFDREAASRFGIVPRRGDSSQVRWFEGPACYMFHTLNAYEDGDELVLLGCRMRSTDVASPPGHSTSDPGHSDRVESANGNGERGRMYRWRFDLATGEVREEPLDDVGSDFPRFEERLMGRPIRFGYAARFSAASETTPLFDGILKYDFDDGSIRFHSFGQGRYGGEAVFVPRPDARAEDDGWLLTIVRDDTESQSELVVVRAQDMEADPEARVILPQRVPYGFHACWVGEDQLAASDRGTSSD